MVNYLYTSKPVIDPVTGNLVADASLQFYAEDDPGHTTPIPVTDVTGLPLAAITTNRLGLHAPFIVADKPVGVLSDGTYSVAVDSPAGMLAAAVASAASSASSATSAAASAEAAEAFVNDILANVIVEVDHGDDPDVARPAFLGKVWWLGTVEPNNMQSVDKWWEIQPQTGGGFVGAMDPFTLPWRAFSLRRLLSTYAGPLVRVRRSSDDTTTDVGYNADGTLDTVSLLAFVGANNGFVTRWFDQTGGGSHLEQGTLAAQPSIVTAGVVNTLDSLPAVTFDGTNDYLTTATAGLFDAGAATMGLVFSGAAVSNSVVVGESNNGGGGALYRLLRSSTAAMNVQATNGSGVSMWANSVAGDTTFDAAQHQVFYADSGSQINTWRDGATKHVALAAVRSGTTPLTNLSLGAHLNGGTPANFLNGKVQELVLWNSNQSVDRVAISTAQKTFWGTP
jgi:hypothetical protein